MINEQKLREEIEEMDIHWLGILEHVRNGREKVFGFSVEEMCKMARIYLDKLSSLLPQEKCEHKNIESNMCPLHCTDCGKILDTPKVDSLDEEWEKKFYEVMGLETDPNGTPAMYLIRDEDGNVLNGIDFSDEREELKSFIHSVHDRAYEDAEISQKSYRSLLENLVKVLEEKLTESKQDALAEYRKGLVEQIRNFDFKEQHICRFNDGESDCDCYLAALHAILSLLTDRE